MSRRSLLRRSFALAAAGTLVATFLPAQSAAQAEPAVPHGGQGAIAAPDHALGGKWRSSSDVVVTGAGDADGFHLYIAREKNAFGWQTLATLKSTEIDVGPWGGSVCVTGSGRYAVAVFAPLKASNDPRLMMAGALGAVVDTTTGQATAVAAGLQFSYFNPACGPGDRALLTRAIGEDTAAGRSTDLLTVDAAAGKVVSTRHIDAQFTTPAPGPDGDYGVVAGRLVKVSPTSGAVTPLGHPQGRPFAVRATAGGGIDVVSADGETAVAQRYSGGKFATTATGPRTKVQLFGLGGGLNALVGQVSRAAGGPSDLTTIAEQAPVDSISRDGHLIVRHVLPRETAAAAADPLKPVDPRLAGQMRISAHAVAGNQDADTLVDTTTAPILDVDLEKFSAVQTERVAAADAPTSSPCMIPRNDPTIQPLQPSPNQVEWAVDNAVHGALTASRPANYLKAGLPSYSPQAMFPLETARHSDGSLSGSGRVPANLELGILAQETNLSQASWHEVPGDTGNPLIASYYGSFDIDTIDYSKSDCGYGIGQVTTGMSSKDDPLDRFTHNQQVAVAVDYEANIAASINILVNKWNQLHLEPDVDMSTVNDDNADYVENWFLALWAYNSGLHTYAQRDSPQSGGYYGLGWLNNPANPDYSSGRQGFMRATLDDAKYPNRWSYPERIMGWVEEPQIKGGDRAYSLPGFGSNPDVFIHTGLKDDHLPHLGVALPDLYAFCDTQFGCSSSTNGCPAVNNSCWWHGHVTFADCSSRCTRENLAVSPGSGSEPAVVRTYPMNCQPFDPFSVSGYDSSVAINMVYTLNDTSQYNLGCSIPGGNLGGKFLLRGGKPAGQYGAPYADIDLHQQGAGYMGHSWFTHGAITDSAQQKHKIVAAWEPEMPLGKGQTKKYSIWAHQPSHGGTWASAVYNIQLAANNGNYVNSPAVDQGPEKSGDYGTDHWVNLGNYTLGRGAQVLLSNVGAPTDADVGYDAMAFVPML